MRLAWQNHVELTMLFLSRAGGDDAPIVAALMRNQEEIGRLAGRNDTLVKLLKEHIGLAAELVAALRSGDSSKASAIDARWAENAEQISRLLSDAGIGSFSSLKKMMMRHLDVTKEEAGEWLAGRVESALDVYHKKVLPQALMMAGHIVDGMRRPKQTRRRSSGRRHHH